MTRPNADETPESEFVQKMRAVFRRRDVATTPQEKLALKDEMVALMFTYLGRSAWDAARAAGVELPPDVPRGTTAARTCHADAVVDRKVAAAGPEAD